MKTHNRLYPQICQFDNLLLAAKRATRGKSLYPNVLEFNYELETNLFQLQHELMTFSYQPGSYRTFYIYEPKKRLISAAPFRDRVVHHALCNIIEPLFERSFIDDSYANRLGKGTHRAIRRLQSFMRKNRYVLKLDIVKYFPSIDHELLKAEIRRVISDPETLWLIDLILDNSNPQETVIQHFPGDDLLAPLERRRGLPIGNLTSQFFANVYLNRFDHYVKEILRCRYYIRYVDDSVILSNYREQLWENLCAVKDYLGNFRLKVHDRKSQIRPVTSGVTFLGQVVYPYHRLLKDENVKKFTRKMKRFVKDYANGEISLPEIDASVQSWLGHARQANTYQLRRSILKKFVFSHHANVEYL